MLIINAVGVLGNKGQVCPGQNGTFYKANEYSLFLEIRISKLIGEACLWTQDRSQVRYWTPFSFLDRLPRCANCASSNKASGRKPRGLWLTLSCALALTLVLVLSCLDRLDPGRGSSRHEVIISIKLTSKSETEEHQNLKFQKTLKTIIH